MLDWEHQILTNEETAKKLRVSTRTLDRICLEGGLRRLQISPRRVGFFVGEVLAFAKSKQQSAA